MHCKSEEEGTISKEFIKMAEVAFKTEIAKVKQAPSISRVICCLSDFLYAQRLRSTV